MRTGLLLLILLAAQPSWGASDAACSLADSNGCCANAACWEKTCSSLYRLGSLLAAPAWVNSSGWLQVLQASDSAAAACQGITSADYCSWHGVTCNETQLLGTANSCSSPAAARGVSRLILTNNNIMGQINDSCVFDEIKLLHDCGLTHLVLGGTSFGLTGHLTPEFGQLHRLRVLGIFGSNITGTIPPQMGSMTALQELDLSTCYLSGTIPPELGRLENLRLLNLGLNGFSDIGVAMHGPLPTSFLNLKRLNMLNLEQNSFSGTLPATLCRNLPSLQAISLQNNQFEGPATQLGLCRLTALDISDNNFSGSVPRPIGTVDDGPWRQLQTLRLNNNNFTGTIPNWQYDEVPPLLATITLHNNSLTGTLPVSWTLLPWLTLVDVSFNDLSGTLPWQLAFQSRLASLIIANNPRLGGTISPWFRLTVGLQVINALGTNLTGVLPGISRSQFAALDNHLDRLCGSNASGLGRLPYLASVSISSTNMSADCAPDGICNNIDDALPWYLIEDKTTWLAPLPEARFSDNANMQCPLLVQDRFCRRNQTPEQFQPEHRPAWRVSPSYYHYIGCRCADSFHEIRELKWHGSKQISTLRCIQNNALDAGTVAAISAVCSFVFLLLVAYVGYVSWYGRWGLPKLQRAYVDFKKRLYGIPTSGKVSLVVTDIESYSALMVAMPLVMGKALSQHNNVIRKAAWTHYGFITGQEGDAYIVAFREPMDATAFCLQVQQALRKMDWLPELLMYQQQLDSAAAFPGQPAVASAAAGLTAVDADSSGHSTQPSLRGDEVPLTADATAAAAAGATPVVQGLRSPSTSMHGRPALQQSPAGVGVEPLSSDGSGVSLGKFWPFRGAAGSPMPPVVRLFSRRSADESTKLQHGLGPNQLQAGDGPQAAGGGSGHADSSEQLTPIAAVSLLIPGLRVRMGVASGILGEREDCLNCKVLDVARAVSDAASGGQVLLDSPTFGLIRSRLEELGHVSAYGYRRSSRVTGWGQPRGWLARLLAMQNVQLATEALVLDMGLYSIPGFPFKLPSDEAGLLPALPGCPQPAGAGAALGVAGSCSAATAHSGPGSRLLMLQQIREGSPSAARSSAAPVTPSAAVGASGRAAVSSVFIGGPPGVGGLLGCLRLYQVLAPKLIERAHIFGNRLCLKEGSACHDLPYFSAPAAATRPMLQQLLQHPAAGQHTTSANSGSMLATASQHRKLLSMLSNVQVQHHQAAGDPAYIQRGSSGEVAAAGATKPSRVRRLLLTVASLPSGLQLHLRRQERRSASSTAAAAGSPPNSPFSGGAAAAAAAAAGSGHRGSTASLFSVPGAVGSVVPLVPHPSRLHLLAGAFTGDAATTFVFCSVIMPQRHRLEATSAKLSDVAHIVGRIIRQCLLAVTESAAAPADEPGAVAGGSGSNGSNGGSSVRGSGYLCRDTRTDMKYILAFSSPRMALEWCLLVQEVMLWQDWPTAALDKAARSTEMQHGSIASLQSVRLRSLTPQRPAGAVVGPPLAAAAPAAAAAAGDGEEQPAGAVSSQLLFRGPRIKMGVAAGAPQSVWPDYLGRADYHGHAVNMAARYEAVCCQGGQVVCDAMLAEAAVAEWMELKMPPAATGAVSAITEASSSAATDDDEAAREEQPGASADALEDGGKQLDAAATAADEQQQQQQPAGPVQHPLAVSSPPAPASALSSPFHAAANLPSSRNLPDADTRPSGGGGSSALPCRGRSTERCKSAALPDSSGPVAAAAAAARSGLLSEAGSAPSSVPLTPPRQHKKQKATPGGGRGQHRGRPCQTLPEVSGAGQQQLQQQQTPGGGADSSSGVVDGPVLAGGHRGRLPAGHRSTGALHPPPAGACTAAAATPGSAAAGRRGSRGASRSVIRASGGGAAAVVLEPPAPVLPCPSCVSALPCELVDVELHSIGRFQLKGAAGPVDMVEVVLGHLAGCRRLLHRSGLPTGGKGKLLEAPGPGPTICAAVSGVKLPAVGAAYRQQYQQRATAAAAAAAAEAELRNMPQYGAVRYRSESAATDDGSSSSSAAARLRQISPLNLFTKSMSSVGLRSGSWRSSYHSTGSTASRLGQQVPEQHAAADNAVSSASSRAADAADGC